MTKTRAVSLLTMLALWAAGGCSSPSANPAGPSPAAQAAGASSASGTAVITGTLARAGAASANLHAQAAVAITITISGTNISTTAAPGGTFVLAGVPSGNVELHFSGPGVDARATIPGVQDGEEIEIVVSVAGSTANVSITSRGNHGDQSELEGLIASIDLAGRKLVVNGITVTMPAGVVIRHGNTVVAFADLKVGQRVHVRGVKNGSSIVASEVMLQDRNPPGGNEPHAA